MWNIDFLHYVHGTVAGNYCGIRDPLSVNWGFLLLVLRSRERDEALIAIRERHCTEPILVLLWGLAVFVDRWIIMIRLVATAIQARERRRRDEQQKKNGCLYANQS